MCGILFCKQNPDSQDSQDSQESIPEIFSCIKYRGPDNTTIYEQNGFIFCHHRLAIINTTENGVGNQPIIKDGLILIANGEIYNYNLLTDSPNDCEAIIDAYQQNTLQDLDGDFAFVLYDSINNCIITGRDPVGLKPLYIGFSDSDCNSPIAFASEMKVLSKISSVVHIVPHPINTINKYIISDDKIVFESSSQILNYNVPIKEQTYEEALECIRENLIESVRKRIFHTERPCAFLCSGGIDSVITVAIAVFLLKPLGIPVNVYTLALDSDSSYDALYANMFVNHLKTTYSGISHTKVKFSAKHGTSLVSEIIEKLETHDPNTIRASIPMYLLAKFIKENSNNKVIISGEGSDELFMGYNYFSTRNPTYEQAEKESLRLIQGLYSFDVLRAERCFSCHGLELRVPFLDRTLIDNAIQISAKYRLPIKSIEKYILRDAFKDHYVPENILYRQKERMSDGVGFTWVPTLINYSVSQMSDYIDPEEKMTTNTRIKYEKMYYKQIYDSFYKHDTIIFREMPDWATQVDSSNILGI